MFFLSSKQHVSRGTRREISVKIQYVIRKFGLIKEVWRYCTFGANHLGYFRGLMMHIPGCTEKFACGSTMSGPMSFEILLAVSTHSCHCCCLFVECVQRNTSPQTSDCCFKLSFQDVWNQFTLEAAICQSAGQSWCPHAVSSLFSPCVCIYKCFQMYHVFLMTCIRCSKHPRLYVFAVPPPLVPEIVESPNRGLICLDDNMWVLKLICADLFCVHMQVISVISPLSNQAAGLILLFVCPSPSLCPWLEFLHFRENLPSASSKWTHSPWQGLVVSLNVL